MSQETRARRRAIIGLIIGLIARVFPVEVSAKTQDPTWKLWDPNQPLKIRIEHPLIIVVDGHEIVLTPTEIAAALERI